MLTLIVRALAVWRLTQLIVDDELTRPLRDHATGRVAYLLNCTRCTSVWAALLMVVCPAWLARVLAWSAFSILLDEWRGQRAATVLARRMHGAQPVPASQGRETRRA